MKARSLVLLGALSAMLAPARDPRAQQTDASAKPRTIIFVWDGLRADDLTPEITPNYFALGELAPSSPTITRSIRPSR
jgi:predicted AlkP superfamily pyrophosphatase or phosphodiesterase